MKLMLAAAGRTMPADRLEQRGLAGAVRSDHGDELARADRERHVASSARRPPYETERSRQRLSIVPLPAISCRDMLR